MNRRKGFSLVELLIVLAVMAALIATITPVALNAIKKANATQIGQNIKTLASAIENSAYVNGVEATGQIKELSLLSQLGRDIKTDEYGVFYTSNSGTYTVTVYTAKAGDYTTVLGVLNNTGNFKSGAPTLTAGAYTLSALPFTSATMYYEFSFNVY